MRTTASLLALLVMGASGCGGCGGSSAGDDGRCGDGVRDGGEACDPGAAPPATCREDCTLVRCGDGLVDPGEACDLAGANADVAGADCRTDCTPARCGDGVVDPAEECDDGSGNGDAPAECRTNCIRVVCGDGVVGPGEECDDGPDNSDTRPAGCRTGCRMAYCGDGVVDPGERCDEGGDNSGTAPGACRLACVPAACGDGVVDPGEGCDLAEANGAEGSPCRADCSPATCGDGVLDSGEGCDHGPDNSDVEPDACRTTCVPAGCGDGVVDRREGCDDGTGNSDHAPGACRTSCLRAFCGDGVVDAGETCDDGAANSDVNPGACRGSCIPPSCGDRVIDPGEECDDGGRLPGDGCDATCSVEGAARPCGNGTLDAGEECDDGNRLEGDGCSAACVREELTCGGLGPLLDLATVGTLDPATGWLEAHGAFQLYEPSTTVGTCGGTGPERFFLYQPAITGTLIVEAQVDGVHYDFGTLEIRRRCEARTSALECGMVYARLILDRVDPADGPLYFVLDAGTMATDRPSPPFTYSIKARMLPNVPAGGACSFDGATGSCEPRAGLACVRSLSDPAVGTCRARVPIGGNCSSGDPCVEGAECVVTGGSSTCRDLCGNGVVEAGEECDDGNPVDGDNCSNACELAGDDCTLAFDLTSVWDPVAGRARWIGRLELFTPGFTASCALQAYASARNADAVVSFTAPTAGVYSFAVEGPGWFPELSLSSGGCGTAGHEIGCREAAVEGQPIGLTVPLAAGQTVWAVVDGYDTYPDHEFTLTVERPSCGDGRLTFPETCDDGNHVDGDGCDASCRLEGETCAAPWPIPWDATANRAVWQGTTVGRVADHTASCLTASFQPDAVGRFVAPAAGRYSFELDPGYRGAMAIWRGGCGGTEVGCVEATPVEPNRYLAATLAAGEVVDVVVDGEDAWYSREVPQLGPYTLTIRPIVCGNAVLEAPEECDDGNAAAGDGCSAACATEYAEVEPNDQRGSATSIPVHKLVRGRGDDVDYYALTLTGGQTHQVSTWSGTVGSCLGGVDLALFDDQGVPLVEVPGGGYACSRLTYAPGVTRTVVLRVQAGKGYSVTPDEHYFFRID